MTIKYFTFGSTALQKGPQVSHYQLHKSLNTGRRVNKIKYYDKRFDSSFAINFLEKKSFVERAQLPAYFLIYVANDIRLKSSINFIFCWESSFTPIFITYRDTLLVFSPFILPNGRQTYQEPCNNKIQVSTSLSYASLILGLFINFFLN